MPKENALEKQSFIGMEESGSRFERVLNDNG